MRTRKNGCEFGNAVWASWKLSLSICGGIGVLFSLGGGVIASAVPPARVCLCIRLRAPAHAAGG